MLRGYRRVSRAAAKMFKTVISMWSARISKNTEYSLMLNKKNAEPLAENVTNRHMIKTLPTFANFRISSLSRFSVFS